MTSSPTDLAVRCRWVTPTVFLDAPYWVEAEASPWSCIRDAMPRPLATTADCRRCRRFEPAGPWGIASYPEPPDAFR